jgi:hypothetical protein
VRTEALPLLRSWSEQAFDLDAPINVPRLIHWTLFRKAAT